MEMTYFFIVSSTMSLANYEMWFNGRIPSLVVISKVLGSEFDGIILVVFGVRKCPCWTSEFIWIPLKKKTPKPAHFSPIKFIVNILY